jgi:hypothetical protein
MTPSDSRRRRISPIPERVPPGQDTLLANWNALAQVSRGARIRHDSSAAIPGRSSGAARTPRGSLPSRGKQRVVRPASTRFTRSRPSTSCRKTRRRQLLSSSHAWRNWTTRAAPGFLPSVPARCSKHRCVKGAAVDVAMNGGIDLDRFLQTDPRDVGYAEALRLLRVYFDLVARDGDAAERYTEHRSPPARVRPLRRRFRQTSGRRTRYTPRGTRSNAITKRAAK